MLDRYCLSANELTLNSRDILEIDKIPHAYLSITKLYLSHNLLSSLTGIDQFTHLTHLSLTHNSISSITELLKLKNSENLLVLSIKGNPCVLHPNAIGNVLTIFPKLMELDGEEMNDHVKQDLSDAMSVSKKLVEYIYKNELILIEKDLENKRLKIKFELFRKLKGRIKELKGPCWEDVNAIQSKELRRMQEFPKLPNYRHYKKIRPYMLQNLIEVSNTALHDGIKGSYDHPEFLRIYKWLFCEILLHMHEYGNTELQTWLQSQTSSFITGSDPEAHFQMQLRIFSLLAPSCGDNPHRTHHQDVLPDLRMSAAVRKASLYEYMKPVDPRDVLEVNFWNRKDLSVFPVFGMSSDYLRALLSIIEEQLKSIKKLEIEKTDLLRVDTSVLGLPSLCESIEEEQTQPELQTRELSFGDSWMVSQDTFKMKDAPHEDVYSNPFRTDRYAEEQSTHMNPSPSPYPLNAESPDLLHNYVNLRFPNLGSSSDRFIIPKSKSLNITSIEPFSIFTPDKSQEISEVKTICEETMIKKEENETQSTTIEKFSYEPSLSPNVLIEESYVEEIDQPIDNTYSQILRYAFNIWKRAETQQNNLASKKVEDLISSPYYVDKLKGEKTKELQSLVSKKNQKIRSKVRTSRSRSDQKLNEIKAQSYRTSRLKLDSFFIWKNFILNHKRNRLRTYKEIVNSATTKENLRTLIKQIISEQKQSKRPSKQTKKRSSSYKEKDKINIDITKLLKDIHCSDSKFQEIYHKIRSVKSRPPTIKTLRMPKQCEICAKDKAQRLSKEIQSVTKDIRETISKCRVCKDNK